MANGAAAITTQPLASAAQSANWKSVPALVTYWLLAIESGTLIGVFWLIWSKALVTTIMFGLLSGLLGIQNTLLTAAVSFWVGSTVGAKASGDALAASNMAATSAVATLAGAPPPTHPTPSSPVAVVVKSSADDPVVVKEAAPTPPVETP